MQAKPSKRDQALADLKEVLWALNILNNARPEDAANESLSAIVSRLDSVISALEDE